MTRYLRLLVDVVADHPGPVLVGCFAWCAAFTRMARAI